MSSTGGGEWAPGGWEMFLLACRARSANSGKSTWHPSFRLAGSTSRCKWTFRSWRTSSAGAIDNDQGGFQSVIVLTSRRIYWSSREAEGGGGPPRPMQPSAIRSYGLDYALIQGQVEVESSGRGKHEIRLGSGRTLTVFGARPGWARCWPLSCDPPRPPRRTGVVPPLGEQDPELAGRIVRVLPKVCEVTTRVRGPGAAPAARSGARGKAAPRRRGRRRGQRRLGRGGTLRAVRTCASSHMLHNTLKLILGLVAR